jgi:hypothetical protein
MRVSFFSLLALPFIFSVGYADEPVVMPDVASTTQDYDQHIKTLKTEIERYEGYALAFDRKAQRLQTRDLAEYRRSLKLREECKAIAEDLKKHMNELEQQKNAK